MFYQIQGYLFYAIGSSDSPAMTILKVEELIGTSEKSWQDALEKGIERANKTIRNIRGVEVVNWKGEVQNGRIVEYRTVMKIAFEVEDGGR